MKVSFIIAWHLLLQPITFALASPEPLLYPPSYRNSYRRRLQILDSNDTNEALNILRPRDDYTCGSDKPCSNGACCGQSGYCGYGSTYCGTGCTSNCNAVAECGKDSKDGKTTCPLNTCCSQFGFCGTTSEFCGTGCQSNCVAKPAPPAGSTKGNTLSRVIGYYEAWNARSTCHAMQPNELPLAALTHLNYAFAYLDPSTFKVTTMDAATPTSLFDDISDLKVDNPDLKIFVSLGGWTFSDNDTYTQPIFGNIARSASNRQTFADGLVTFLNHYGFDGVDLDWEYPGAPDRGGKSDDTSNYVELVKTLRATFDRSGRSLGLTFTAPSSFWYLRWFDLPGMMKYCDWVNLMSYDLHGTWDSTNPIGSIVQGHTNLTEIKLAAELFWRVNIPAHQIALGFGFYGRAFTLSNPSCTTPGCPFSGGAKAGVCTKTSGYLAYYEVQDILKKDPSIQVHHDKEAAVKYFTFDTDQWISYDDADTFKQKIEWADSMGFSGSLIWASDLDDFDFTAHAALTGKDKATIDSQLTRKNTVNSQMTTDALNSYLRKDCYVQPDSLTSCKAGDDQVGYDKAGRSKDYKPICCPKGSGMTQCQWRGGTGGTNAGRDCNGQCHAGEVKITTSDYGGSPGESSETAHCTRGKKAFCCSMGMLGDALGSCDWSSGVGSTCKSDQQKLAYMWDKTGYGTVFKHGNEFCCPKSEPPPLLDCRWVGKGDCADNTCSGSEVTLLTDGRGDDYGGCSWGRKRSLCCTPNTSSLQTETCDLDLCSLPENQAACEDEAGPVDPDDQTSLRKRSYITGTGQRLWTYDGMSSESEHSLEARGIVAPGTPRTTVIKLADLLGSAIYGSKEIVMTSRRYWPGQTSLLNNDGITTLPLRGGFDFVRDTCTTTALRYVPYKDFARKGWEFEHIRELNMIHNFVRSLLTGKLFSGLDMKTKLDPMAVAIGWTKKYDVSLPRIGVLVRDAPKFSEPISPNDRIFETLGSYAYRGGVSFVPKALNLVKRTLMEGNSPLGKEESTFNRLLKQVAVNGDEVVMKKILSNMQLTIGTFNYLNDELLHPAFLAAGHVLSQEMARADQYMPELKGILAAWKEWEVDYYAHVAFLAKDWLENRGGLIAEKFAGNLANNPSALKLVTQAAQLVGQAKLIKSPLAP